ncbi:MAG TPA: UDP-N-acetylmuramoyl-L-alanine--D-glutamate ligase [Candidatus Sulfotelmatobacter sp.]|nr:UDP-N-acetylmuramoyl-L-alanine--D-glutamate ligase [Candidatus Sulfotelmatobacter sp.]
MKIAIVGYGLEGKSSYAYFSKDPANVITICDKDESIDTPADTYRHVGEDYLKYLEDFDLIVRTAGLNPNLILDATPGVEDKITTQLNEFLSVCPSKNIIGVTGTKGKGTTVTLIYKMLVKAGVKAVLGGNIGIPFLSLLDDIQDDTYVVLELSSFQLCDLKEKSPHIAVCLMVVPEHLNWHDSVEDYYKAKSQLFIHQSAEDTAICYADNKASVDIARQSPGKLIPYFKAPGAEVKDGTIIIESNEICPVSDVKLLGEHNLQNICAALTSVWQVSQDVSSFRQVITSFTGLEHRLELVREVDGVKYYNDSFASSLKATEAAVEAIEGKKVLIVGGFDRKLNIDEFGEYVVNHQDEFRKILVIGEIGQKLKELFDRVKFDNYDYSGDLRDMTQIVKRAKELAASGDSVVLSPGFASFDMFKNFEDRGNQFKQAVSSL